MAEEWAADVLKYDPGADHGVIDGIVRYCGIALRNHDSSLVSFSDPAEVGRVRENFLKKKLALTGSDEVLDRAIANVGDQMQGATTKNRVTVYYLLAKAFGKLDLFGGTGAAATGVAAAGAAGAATAAGLGSFGDRDHVATTHTGAAHTDTDHVGTTGTHGLTGATAATAAGAGALGMAAATSSDTRPAAFAAETHDHGVHHTHDGLDHVHEPARYSAADTTTTTVYDEPERTGGMGWLWWLLLGLGLLALLWWLFLRPHPTPADTETAVATDTTVAAAPMETVAAGTVAGAGAAATGIFANAPAEGSATIPTGAGVTSEIRDTKPVVKVYFDTAKTAVTPAFTETAAGLKDYLASHSGSSLAVSGYNDPTGNAAANAELSKNRAQAVRDALVKAGIPETAVELVKPDAATQGTGSDAEARRVEVVVR